MQICCQRITILLTHPSAVYCESHEQIVGFLLPFFLGFMVRKDGLSSSFGFDHSEVMALDQSEPFPDNSLWTSCRIYSLLYQEIQIPFSIFFLKKVVFKGRGRDIQVSNFLIFVKVDISIWKVLSNPNKRFIQFIAYKKQ